MPVHVMETDRGVAEIVTSDGNETWRATLVMLGDEAKAVDALGSTEEQAIRALLASIRAGHV